jgi:hypothetical protein
MGAIEEVRRGTIHQDKKAQRRNIMHYPNTHFLPKTTSPEQVQKKLAVDMIVDPAWKACLEHKI